MVMPIIAVASPSFSSSAPLRHELAQYFPHYQIKYFEQTGVTLSSQSLVDFLQNAEMCIVGHEVIDEQLLKQLPHLRTISKYGVGVENIDQQALKKHNIQFGWTGGVNRNAVAELTIGLMLNLIRGIFNSAVDLRNKNWKPIQGRELSSMTIGIIGCGNIGKEVLKRAQAFGSKLLAHDLLDFPDFYRQFGVKKVGLIELLQNADIVSLHVPLTPLTRGLLSKEKLLTMKSGSYLINTARGKIVDEAALVQALSTGHLAGAAFDVFETEPISPSTNSASLQLLEFPQFIGTPHIGGASQEARMAMGRAAIQGLMK